MAPAVGEIARGVLVRRALWMYVARCATINDAGVCAAVTFPAVVAETVAPARLAGGHGARCLLHLARPAGVAGGASAAQRERVALTAAAAVLARHVLWALTLARGAAVAGRAIAPRPASLVGAAGGGHAVAHALAESGAGARPLAALRRSTAGAARAGTRSHGGAVLAGGARAAVRHPAERLIAAPGARVARGRAGPCTEAPRRTLGARPASGARVSPGGAVAALISVRVPARRALQRRGRAGQEHQHDHGGADHLDGGLKAQRGDPVTANCQLDLGLGRALRAPP